MAVWKWARRHPLPAVLLAATVILIGILLRYNSRLREANRAATAALEEANERRIEAEKQRNLVQRYRFAASLKLAQGEWERNQVPRALELLAEGHSRTGSNDLRSFDWYYLWRLCHSDAAARHAHPAGIRERGSVTMATGLEQVQALALAPDAGLLATGDGKQTVKLWRRDGPGWSEYARFCQPRASVWVLAFAPDGRTLAFGYGEADQWGEVKLLDMAGEEQVLRGFKNVVRSVAFSPDGSVLAAASGEQGVRLWDLAHTQELAPRPTGPRLAWSVAISPNGKSLAVAVSSDPAAPGSGAEVIVWDWATRRERHRFSMSTAHAVRMAFAPDSRLLAVSSDHGPLEIWDLETGRPQDILRGSGSPSVLAFSPDGRTVVIDSWDARAGRDALTLIDAVTGQERLALHGPEARISCVAFSRDGRTLVSGDGKGVIRLWRAAAEAEVTARERGMPVPRRETPAALEPGAFLPASPEAVSTNSNSLIRRHRDWLTVTASSTWEGWPAQRLIDNNVKTSWCSAQGDSAGWGRSTWFQIDFPEDATIRRITVLGNRGEGCSVLTGQMELHGAEGRLLHAQSGAGRGPFFDFDWRFGEPVAGVRRVTFHSLTDQGDQSHEGCVALGEVLIE